jgi:N-hydroxyarylamine O-acetyltransferase
MSSPITPDTAALPMDNWDVHRVDLPAYLARIGHPHVSPSAESLRSLTEAHVRAIPFENVDVLLGTHRGIGMDVITDKLIYRQRGGYCYEHTLLFAAVAEQLGFPVRRLIARVQPQRSGARTHMTLRITADGVDHLVDVGFGAGMFTPMPLRDGVVVDQAGWPHRLTADNGTWTLAKQTGAGWLPLHAFDESAQRPIDYQVAHHYVSTHPNSRFVGQLIVMRLDRGVSRRLVDDQLTVEYSDGRLERTLVPLERLDDVLRELDVVLDRGELAELRGKLPVSAGRPW